MRSEEQRTPKVDLEFIKQQFRDLEEERKQTNRNISSLRAELRRYNEQISERNLLNSRDFIIVFLVSFIQYMIHKWLI